LPSMKIVGRAARVCHRRARSLIRRQIPRLRGRLCPRRDHSSRSHPARSRKARPQPAHSQKARPHPARSQMARSQPTHSPEAESRRHHHQAKALRRQFRPRRAHRPGCAAAAPGSRAAARAVRVSGAESRPGRLPKNRLESAMAEAAARSPRRRRSPVPPPWVGTAAPRVALTPLRGRTGLGHRATQASRAAVGRCCPARRSCSSAGRSRSSAGRSRSSARPSGSSAPRSGSSAAQSGHSGRPSRHSTLRSHRLRRRSYRCPARRSGRCPARRSDHFDRRRSPRLSLCPDRPSPPRPRAVISLLASAGAATIP
jgi:hypothetical protein